MFIRSGILLLLIIVLISAAPGKKDLWQNWDDITKLNQENPKPIFIDMYTDWCHYCKVMDATTYKNDSVIAYLKQHYYRYKFNAEGKDSISWQGKKFAFSERYGINDFGVYLTQGNIVYPTTIIITPGGQPFYQPGELKASEIELLLKYFSNPDNNKVSLEHFAKDFTPNWK